MSLSVGKPTQPQRLPSHSSDTADMYRHPFNFQPPGSGSGASSLYSSHDNRVQFTMGNDESYVDADGHRRVRLASQV